MFGTIYDKYILKLTNEVLQSLSLFLVHFTVFSETFAI